MFRRGRKLPGRSSLTAFIDEGSQIEEGVLFEGHCRMAKVNQITEVPRGLDVSVVPMKR